MENRWLLAITVNTLVDEADGSIVDGDVSLRDALAAAPAGETIDFAASLDGGTILLTMGELAVTDRLTIDATGLPSGLTIDGSGNDPTPDSTFVDNDSSVDGDGSRVLNIDDGDDSTDSQIVIRGLTLTGGDLDGDGGAIRSRESLAIISSVISGNFAMGNGGGVWATGNITVSSSTIAGNRAGICCDNTAVGGGIAAGGNVMVDSSTLSGNSASASGGGIWASGEVTVVSGTLSGNQANNGGGISASGNVTVTHSTLFGNKGRTVVTDSSATVTIVNSIVAGEPSFERLFMTGTLAVRYSLISNNQDTNLVEAPVGAPDANGNLIGGPINGFIRPLLVPLADNGGPTKTHALASSSPAMDVGDPSANPSPEFDQRGAPFVRVSGGRIDMGAFERQPVDAVNLVVDTLADEIDMDFSAGDLSLREAIFMANFHPGADTITFDASLNNGTILLARGGLVIFDDLEIDATALANRLTIDASDTLFVFNMVDVDDSIDAPLVIRGLTLIGGRSFVISSYESLTISSSTISSIGTAVGIASNGDVTVISSTISGDASELRSRVISADRGGIVAGGDVTVISSTISGNSASRSGGGVWARGNITITSSTLSGNSTGNKGGGVYSFRDVMVTSSTISGNSAASGGGLHANGDLSVTSSTISGNSAIVLGGGIWGDQNATVTIKGSIVAGNMGRPDNAAPAPDIRFHSSGTLDVRYSLIGDNSGTGLPESPVGTPDANGNLIGDPRAKKKTQTFFG